MCRIGFVTCRTHDGTEMAPTAQYRGHRQEFEKVREDARHLMLFERARELLVEDEE